MTAIEGMRCDCPWYKEDGSCWEPYTKEEYK